MSGFNILKMKNKTFKIKVEKLDNKPSEELIEMFKNVEPYKALKAKLTIKDLEQYIKDIWKSKPISPRDIVIGRRCDYRGLVSETTETIGINHCGNKDCKGCNNYSDLINEAIKDWANK